ncbi:MAG TPA: serine protease [Candidatus Kaiserbacteria bacterium]|nr:serine protease [Candidatus Kaiserbacteria bacterium]
MDIERLTKSQIVLLVLLVSFVTSIATGIVTVTLLEEAPPVVTQTINRIVEKTVERVVPGNTQTATVIETKKTIVVNEEDLITTAIEKNKDKIVKIYRKTADKPIYVGVGVLVSKSGIVAAATDASILNPNGVYIVILSNGEEAQGKVVKVKEESDKPTSLLKLTFTKEDKVVPRSIKYGDINSLKLGYTVLTLQEKERTSIALGIISGLDEKETKIKAPEESGKESKTISVLQTIETNINSNKIEKGGILINLFGDVIGISTSESRIHGKSDFTPIQVIQSQIIKLATAETKTETKTEAKTK